MPNFASGTLHVGTQPTDGGAKGAKGCRGGSTGWLDFDQVLKLGAQGRDWWEGKSSSVPEYHGPHPGQVSDRNFLQELNIVRLTFASAP